MDDQQTPPAAAELAASAEQHNTMEGGAADHIVQEHTVFLDLLRVTNSLESQIDPSIFFRKKFSACQEHVLPTRLIKHTVSVLIDCLRRPSVVLQFNTRCALNNLICCTRRGAHHVMIYGGVPALIRLASSAGGKVHDKAICALSNLAAHCNECRGHLRVRGLLPLLVAKLESPDFQQLKLRRIVTRCLVNQLNKGGFEDLQDDLETVDRLMAQLHSTISAFNTGKIHCDAVWSVAYLLDAVAYITVVEIFDLLFDNHPNLVAHIVALLNTDPNNRRNRRVLTGALLVVRSVTAAGTANDNFLLTTALLTFGVLNHLVTAAQVLLVNSDSHYISYECLHIISNMAASDEENLVRLFSLTRMAESVFRMCHDRSRRKRKLAYETLLCFAMRDSPPALYEHLLSGGLAHILVRMLDDRPGWCLLMQSLTALQHALQERPQFRDYAVALFRHVGLVERLMRVARQPHPKPYYILSDIDLQVLATSILRQFFGVFDVHQGNPNPQPPARAPIIVRIRRD